MDYLKTESYTFLVLFLDSLFGGLYLLIARSSRRLTAATAASVDNDYTSGLENLINTGSIINNTAQP